MKSKKVSFYVISKSQRNKKGKNKLILRKGFFIMVDSFSVKPKFNKRKVSNKGSVVYRINISLWCPLPVL